MFAGNFVRLIFLLIFICVASDALAGPDSIRKSIDQKLEETPMMIHFSVFPRLRVSCL